jgi:sulfide:quinone oxidoreductase
VVVLGAGFGGLELLTNLSGALGDQVDVVLVDKSEAFVIGFSKLDVMFGRKVPADVGQPDRGLIKPGVCFVPTTVRSIDPVAKRVETDAGKFEADFLVVALGADLEPEATPGLLEGGHEFYSVPAAFALREVLPGFERGHALIGVCGPTYKCPPAPNEAALLLHDYLTERGLRKQTEITFASDPERLPRFELSACRSQAVS